MKAMKKFFALLLALTMVFGLAATAFAAEDGDGTITVENALEGVTYSAYKIFTLESHNGNNFAYTVANPWQAFVETGAGKDYVKITADGYIEWINAKADEETAQAFAKAALQYAKDNNITPDATQIDALEEGEVIDMKNTATITFDKLPLGYYLIDTSLGNLCSLDTNISDVAIREKNEVPPTDKQVQEDSNNEWKDDKVDGVEPEGEYNTAGVGEVVTYKAIVTGVKGAQSYIIHDKMDTTLDYIGISSVKKGDADFTDYTLTYPATDGDTFDISIDVDLAKGETIVVTYTARVNATAETVIGNTVIVEYGDKNKTLPDSTETKVYQVTVFKYAEESGKDVGLPGATFKVTYDEEGNNLVNIVEESANVYEACFNTDCDHESHVTSITTPGDRENPDTTVDGLFTLKGLDAGTYYLTETDAPDGFNKLVGPVKVVIAEDGKITYTYNGVETGGSTDTRVEILNQSGTELPSTGGMGTTLFYVVGSVMMLGAVVLLITKKRMSV